MGSAGPVEATGAQGAVPGTPIQTTEGSTMADLRIPLASAPAVKKVLAALAPCKLLIGRLLASGGRSREGADRPLSWRRSHGRPQVFEKRILAPQAVSATTRSRPH